jgi:hypothetical protein
MVASLQVLACTGWGECGIHCLLSGAPPLHGGRKALGTARPCLCRAACKVGADCNQMLACLGLSRWIGVAGCKKQVTSTRLSTYCQGAAVLPGSPVYGAQAFAAWMKGYTWC